MNLKVYKATILTLPKMLTKGDASWNQHHGVGSPGRYSPGNLQYDHTMGYEALYGDNGGQEPEYSGAYGIPEEPSLPSSFHLGFDFTDPFTFDYDDSSASRSSF